MLNSTFLVLKADGDPMKGLIDGTYTTLHTTFTGADNTILGGQLSAGSYTCYVTVIVDSGTAITTSTASKDFQVKRNPPPKFEYITPDIELQNPNEKLTIRGKVCFNGRLSIQWESLWEEGTHPDFLEQYIFDEYKSSK